MDTRSVGRPNEAIACQEQQQLAVARQIGAAVGEAFALRNMGRAQQQLGQHDTPRPPGDQAAT